MIFLLLHSAYQYLVADFCVWLHERIDIYFSYLVGYFSGLGIRVLLVSKNNFQSTLFLSITLKNLRMYFRSLFQNLAASPLGTGLLLVVLVVLFYFIVIILKISLPHIELLSFYIFLI